MNFFFFSEFYFDLKILYQIIGYFGADISLSWISQFNRKILLNFAARERERERERVVTFKGEIILFFRGTSILRTIADPLNWLTFYNRTGLAISCSENLKNINSIFPSKFILLNVLSLLSQKYNFSPLKHPINDKRVIKISYKFITRRQLLLDYIDWFTFDEILRWIELNSQMNRYRGNIIAR